MSRATTTVSRHLGQTDRAVAPPSTVVSPGIDLYWIPLGAGTHVVRTSGRVSEALCAVLQRRRRQDLYHSALVVTTSDGPFAIEMTPIPSSRTWEDRGVVAEGAVGTRLAKRFRVFRYEIRCWRLGVIPDLSAAVASPVHLSDDATVAQRLLELVPSVPTPTWAATSSVPAKCGTPTR